VVGEHRLKTPDFMLVGNNVPLSKSYYVRFVHPILEHRCILWSGYINLAKPQITMPGNLVCVSSFLFSYHKKPRPWLQHTGRSGVCSSHGSQGELWHGGQQEAQPLGCCECICTRPVCQQQQGQSRGPQASAAE